MIKKIVLKFLGFYPALLVGDSGVWDRWVWLRRNLIRGNVRTLDAGCGSGAFSLGAARLGNVVTGLSFDARNNFTANERAKILKLESRARFLQQDLRDLAQVRNELGTFDQIICCETIEHIKNDELLLKNFFELLKSKGKLLLTAPYKFYRHLPGDGISDVEDGGHVRWGYTHEEMGALCSRAGLKILKSEYATGFISQQIIRLERLGSAVLPHRAVWVVLFPLRFFTILDPLVTLVLGYPYLSIAVVAVKE